MSDPLETAACELEAAVRRDPRLRPPSNIRDLSVSCPWQSAIYAYWWALIQFYKAQELPQLSVAEAHERERTAFEEWRDMENIWQAGNVRLRDVMDAFGRWHFAGNILRAAKKHPLAEDCTDLIAAWNKRDRAERWTYIDGMRTRRIYARDWS
jgi:hypothetical protein